MNEQQAACSLSQRVLYELQVLCDAGALLRPDIDGELIPLLAAAEVRHGEGALQRRYGEDLALTDPSPNPNPNPDPDPNPNPNPKLNPNPNPKAPPNPNPHPDPTPNQVRRG